ncbi:S-antigen protein-like [Dioscorea cayenensis subsp. rotundata]|uniref:S-antigen protein-like n=1 Tax=Dioscorea cayennensis subsp. rotundata TaxID=55577 RepID=A0AB40BR78_DIOCR|nr:S-antigen protein-like [Dioscorea cayenensis subsp. rotundata]
MIVSWCSAIAEGPIAKLEEDIRTVRRSLEFLGPRVKDFEMSRSSEETRDPDSGNEAAGTLGTTNSAGPTAGTAVAGPTDPAGAGSESSASPVGPDSAGQTEGTVDSTGPTAGTADAGPTDPEGAGSASYTSPVGPDSAGPTGSAGTAAAAATASSWLRGHQHLSTRGKATCG